MQRINHLVKLGRLGISLRYLAWWWDGAEGPRPADLAEGSVRLEMGGGGGPSWDLSGPEAVAFRVLVADAARSVDNPAPSGGETPCGPDEVPSDGHGPSLNPASGTICMGDSDPPTDVRKHE